MNDEEEAFDMNDLFRKEAFDRASSGRDIYRPVRTISISRRIIILMLLIATLAFSLWLFFGTIYETVTAESMVGYSASDGGIYSEADGIISKRMVSAGDTVKSGDIIAIIPNRTILDEIRKPENDSQEKINNLYDKYDHYSVLRSKTDGIVTYIVDENSWVSKGNMVAYVIRYNEEIDSKKLTAFVPASKKELIALNMKARVMPDHAPEEEYGYINSYVSVINSNPVCGADIIKREPGIHPKLDPDENYITVEITMIYSESAKNHLSWSNSMGESLNVTMGTSCNTEIIINECSPFKWLIGGRL